MSASRAVGGLTRKTFSSATASAARRRQARLGIESINLLNTTGTSSPGAGPVLRGTHKTATKVPSMLPATQQRPKEDRHQMLDIIELTWLGTAAGSPSRSRNVSSTAIRLDGEIWFVDVGEATQHQLQRSRVRPSGTMKIFITHMHGDHTFGLVPFLCSLAEGGGAALEGQDPRDNDAATSPPVEIYGLTGTRRLVRTVLECTQTTLARDYRVHELLFTRDKPFDGGRRHHNELAGSDIFIDENKGCWHSFLPSDGVRPAVSAVPIKHTVPCVGYVFEEPPRAGSVDAKAYTPLIKKNKEALMGPPYNLVHPMKILAQLKSESKPITLPDGNVLHPPPQMAGRKFVVLGDTYDAESEAMDELAMEADLVVHEATNAFLPSFNSIAARDENTYDQVEKKARTHGHSTPQVAGRFAKRIRAKNLFLNHFSNRYPDSGSTLEIHTSAKEGARVDLSDEVALVQSGDPETERRDRLPSEVSAFRKAVLQEIERQASEAWDSGRRAIAARDLMTVAIKIRKDQVASNTA